MRHANPDRSDKVLEMVNGYRTGSGPTSLDTLDRGDQSVTFYRILYEVPG